VNFKYKYYSFFYYYYGERLQFFLIYTSVDDFQKVSNKKFKIFEIELTNYSLLSKPNFDYKKALIALGFKGSQWPGQDMRK
jgi:hypothetical protein